MKKYCCLLLEDAVIRGWIKEEEIVNGRPEHNAFIAEFVTEKKYKKFKLIGERYDVSTKEIILKSCIFCGERFI